MNENEAWRDRYRRTMGWRIRLENWMTRSEAFKSIEYLPTLKVLLWSLDRRDVKKTKSRGDRRFVETGKPFSFTYAEAKFRGLIYERFARAVRELVGLGFWDIVKQGSGIKGDYSLYRFSQRWKRYGTPEFETQELQKRVGFGCFKNRKERISNAGSSELPSSASSEFPTRHLPS